METEEIRVIVITTMIVRMTRIKIVTLTLTLTVTVTVTVTLTLNNQIFVCQDDFLNDGDWGDLYLLTESIPDG